MKKNDKPRMVKSPLVRGGVPFDLAAETGTQKVIRDHSTIGLVITTDGSISDIPRESSGRRGTGGSGTGGHQQAFVILLNCVDLRGAASRGAGSPDGGAIRAHGAAHQLWTWTARPLTAFCRACCMSLM